MLSEKKIKSIMRIEWTEKRKVNPCIVNQIAIQLAEHSKQQRLTISDINKIMYLKDYKTY